MATSGTTVLYGSGLTGEIDKILKDVWEPMMQRLFTNETSILQAFKRYSKMPDVGGRKWNVKLHIRPGQGIGSRGERASTGTSPTTTATLPIPVPQTVDDCYVRPTWHYWTVGFTGQALRVAKGDPYSFAKTQTWEMSEVFNEFMYDFNRQLMGNGTGIVAKTAACAAGTGPATFWAQVTTNQWKCTVLDARRFRIGAYYDIYYYTGTVTTASQLATPGHDTTFAYGQCLDVDLDNNTATFYTATDAAPDDSSTGLGYLFCRQGNLVSTVNSSTLAAITTTNEMMGIAGIAEDGTESLTFQNLSRATYPELKGTVSRAVGELTPLKLKTLFDKVSSRTGKRPDACIVGQGVDRAVFAILEPYRRYVGPEVVFGYDTVPIIIDGKKLQWIVEPQLTSGQLLAPKWDTMEYWQIADPAWADDDGKILRKAPENADTWNAFGRFFGNLVCLNPQGNARMEGISEA